MNNEKELQEARWFNCLIKDLPQARLKESFRSYFMRTNQNPDLSETKLNYLVHIKELESQVETPNIKDIT